MGDGLDCLDFLVDGGHLLGDGEVVLGFVGLVFLVFVFDGFRAVLAVWGVGFEAVGPGAVGLGAVGLGAILWRVGWLVGFGWCCGGRGWVG